MCVVTEVGSLPYPLLEQVTGTRWIAIKFFEHLPADWQGVHREPMRFCEAVCQAGRGCIDLSPEMICCEGAKRAFGWAKDRDDSLTLHLSEKTGINRDKARQLVGQVPVLGSSYAGIRVGGGTDPDVLVTYVRPEAAMRLVRLWEIGAGHSLPVDISSIMAVCGNAVVKAHVTGAISISFGCPDSRQYGGVRPEEMVIAVPAGLVNRLAGAGKSEPALSQ